MRGRGYSAGSAAPKLAAPRRPRLCVSLPTTALGVMPEPARSVRDRRRARTRYDYGGGEVSSGRGVLPRLRCARVSPWPPPGPARCFFGSMAVVIGWCTRTWRCLEALCSKGSFTEQDPGIAVLWAVLTRRATRWAVGQLRRERVSVLGLARQAQGDWKTVWRAVNPVLEEADADPVRFAGMRHLGG